MIRNYTDHAANERTFLAWVRTGIAVIAFGFVIEKFNLFLLSIADLSKVEIGQGARLEQLMGPLGRYEGVAFMLVGTGLIGAAAARYVRTARLLDSQQTNSVTEVRTELILSGILMLLVTVYSFYLVLR
jgi:putative membrane protein